VKIPAPQFPLIDEAGPDANLRDYWLARVRQHTDDIYAGVPISKFPEDLRVYEHLLWESGADVVLELGCQSGGSSMWFRDRLETFSRYRATHVSPLVIAVDIDVSIARGNFAAPDRGRGITLIEGDVRDPSLVDQVSAAIPDDARVMVVEDSAHEFDTTLAALTNYSRFVTPGGFFVVEDGCVDIDWMRALDTWPRGVLSALREWLASPLSAGFTVHRELEIYGVTCHPGGFLRRESA
jgi:cephalosporin hydroxylase